MQHPKDVKGSDRPLPRNDGKFVLDGKRVEFSDYGGSSEKPKSLLSIPVGQRYTTILARLDAIESEIKYMKENIEDLDNSYQDIETRIEILEEMTDGID